MKLPTIPQVGQLRLFGVSIEEKDFEALGGNGSLLAVHEPEHKVQSLGDKVWSAYLKVDIDMAYPPEYYIEIEGNGFAFIAWHHLNLEDGAIFTCNTVRREYSSKPGSNLLLDAYIAAEEVLAKVFEHKIVLVADQVKVIEVETEWDVLE